ncbi:PAS domain S-box protein [Nodosilinea sp. PGN35]|uniref:PAS domain S-box protein n=1 Tax=Nodosilinea sp. PGN35 TaxID=3020489 RepID=UPI0023B347E0|nr:PAS domain S-box protein [Nodosilinea sp. TSF1-S3]MDF0369729.1 PAS domain S-box protein [Nodosilinea sp. TSF1-S3]
MATQRTVLVIANSEKDDSTYQQHLQQDRGMDYDILLFGRSNTPVPALARSLPRLDGILLELAFPHNHSFQLLSHLKEQTGAPVIVIDGGDTEVAVQAFKQGAVDYLVKDRMTPEDVRQAMRTAIENAELKRELQRSQETFFTSVENMLDCFGIFAAMRDEAGQIVDFRIDYLNAAACDSNQMPKAMQIGRGLCEILPAHQESGLFDEYCQVVETGEPLVKDSLIYDDTFGDRRLVRAFDIRATKLNDGFVASWRDVTDRRRLELEQQQTALALHQSQERLELAMEAASMGSWDWNVSTGEVRWSTSLEHLFGMAPGSFDGRYETVRAMMHPEDLPRVEEAIRRALDEGAAYTLEFRFIKPDGSVRWALSLGRVFRDEDGSPVMTGVDRDITAWKQAEAALRTSERRYRSLVEATTQIIWNTPGNRAEFTTEQPSWSAFTGQTFDQLKGWGWLNAVHPDDRAKTIQACSTALATQTLGEVEYRLRRQDGVYRHMQTRAVPVFDDDGTILEWIGVNTDITAAQQATAALTDNEARLRGFVESNVVGIIYGDIYGNIHAANDELLRIVGYTQEDVRAGRLRWVDITPPEYLPLDEERIAEARTRGACTPYEKEYIRKDGSRVPVLIGYSLLGEAQDETVVFVLDLSDRKQAQQALQASEERFRQLAENIDAVFWVKELPGHRISYVSSAYERLWGFQPQPLYDNPHHWLNCIHPADRASVAQAFEAQGTTGQFDREYRIVLADGTGRWVRDRCFPLHDEAGNVYRLAGITEDITERKHTEEHLRQSEEFKDRLLESSPDCIKVLDIDGRLLYMNAGGMCIMEIDDLTPYLQQEWIHLWGDEYRSLAQQALEAARAGDVSIFRGFCPTAKGTPKWWEVIVSPIQGESGQTEQVLSVSRDISDRKQVELRLQESQERLQLGMQVAGFALAQIDYSTNTVHLSPEAAALYGLPADQLTLSRDQFYATFHPEDRDHLLRCIEAILDPAGSGWFSQDHRVLWPSGDVKWLTVRKQVFFDRSSDPPRPDHAVLVALDITERKQAEMERSRLLQQEQAARAEAERANRIKDEFLAVLSHELRSPLNPILGWTQLLQSRQFDAERTAQALATIERNAKLQTQLIDDLLDVAKILRGKLVVEMAPVDLGFVIESAIDTVGSAAAAKSIRLCPALSPIGRISGDAARLQQIVWNLVSNAIKFTPNDGQVDILLEQVGTQAQITVSDTGKGIHPDFLPHLFESFRQEDASTTRQYGGLGLGLAIVRSLVEAHGGTITAASPGEGQGATFTVRFPLIDLIPQLPPSPPPPAQALDLTGVRVLAVDDEPDARELLATVLTLYGAEVLTVTSAAEVFPALVSFQPDVLISDIGMPDVDGYGLLQQIRALPPEQGGHVPAIALTAYAREEDHQRAIASGFQQQVTKPLAPPRLVQAVVVLIQSSG